MKYLVVFVCLILLIPSICAKTVQRQEAPLDIKAYEYAAEAYSDTQSSYTLNWDWNTNSPVQFRIKCIETGKVYDFGNLTRMSGSMKLDWGGTWILGWSNYNNYTVSGHSSSWIDDPNESGYGILFWVISFISLFLFVLVAIVAFRHWWK
jgi:hypothetical protein